MRLRRLAEKGPMRHSPPPLAWLDAAPKSTTGAESEQRVRSLGNVDIRMLHEGKYDSTVRLVIGPEFVEVRGTRLRGMFDRVELTTWLASPREPLRVDEAEWRFEYGRIVLCLLNCRLCGQVPRETLGQLFRGTMTVS